MGILLSLWPCSQQELWPVSEDSVLGASGSFFHLLLQSSPKRLPLNLHSDAHFISLPCFGADCGHLGPTSDICSGARDLLEKSKATISVQNPLHHPACESEPLGQDLPCAEPLISLQVARLEPTHQVICYQREEVVSHAESCLWTWGYSVLTKRHGWQGGNVPAKGPMTHPRYA